MRIGANPAKEKPALTGYGLHRIIVPIYIPHCTGYFQHALEILRLCLESLRITASDKAAITVIANGCAPIIVEELEKEYQAGWIDQLLLNQRNRGKIDAVVSVAKGSFEPLITFSDHDVLFKRGWLEAVEELFQVFPECGFVSPLPNPSLEWYRNSATLLEGLLRRELFCGKVVSDADLDRFAKSINRADIFERHRAKQLLVKRNGMIACLGAGHFICTLHRDALAGMPPGPSCETISGRSDEAWLDNPPDKLGLWRLSTSQAWVYHMGNTPEEWMHKEVASLRAEQLSRSVAMQEPILLKQRSASLIPFSLRIRLTKLVKLTSLRKLLYRC